jgi:hypothetical protein
LGTYRGVFYAVHAALLLLLQMLEQAQGLLPGGVMQAWAGSEAGLLHLA